MQSKDILGKMEVEIKLRGNKMKKDFERISRSYLYIGFMTFLCLCVGGCKSGNNYGEELPQSTGTAIESIETIETTPSEITIEPQTIIESAEMIAHFELAINSEGIYCVFDGNKFGYMTETGEELHPCIYDDAAPFSEGLAYFAKDDEYGFMTTDGEVAFYLDCDSVSSFSEGLAFFSTDGKYGYIDKTGQVVIEPVYGMAGFFEGGYAVVAANGYYGIIDKQGNVVVPLQYDSISKDEGKWHAKLEGEFIDLNLKEVDDSNDMPDIYVKGFSKSGELSQGVLQAMLRKNHITPKITPYWKLINSSEVKMDDNGDAPERLSEEYIEEYLLIGMEGVERPVLYYYEGYYIQAGFPESTSAFFALNGKTVQMLISGFECGGSARGDYVCFWQDVETKKMHIGIRGAAGGFGGFAGYGIVYSYENGITEEIFSYDWIEQSASNYSQEELLAKAELLYDENGEPYTTDTVLEAETVDEYLINGETVAKEVYMEETARYKYIHIE